MTDEPHLLIPTTIGGRQALVFGTNIGKLYSGECIALHNALIMFDDDHEFTEITKLAWIGPTRVRSFEVAEIRIYSPKIVLHCTEGAAGAWRKAR